MVRKRVPEPIYRRVILKLSGEMLAGGRTGGIDANALRFIAGEIKDSLGIGVQIGCVIGGGNIFRGLRAETCGLDRLTGDYMGMLATVINGLALRDALENEGVTARLHTAVEMRRLAEPYTPSRARRQFEKGYAVIFAGGTGCPFFSTDTAAALRAAETGADAVLKATKVDGVYSSDPVKDPRARMYRRIDYLDVIEKRLGVMDLTAISLCMDNRLPIIVFNLSVKGNIRKVLMGRSIGTVIGRRRRRVPEEGGDP